MSHHETAQAAAAPAAPIDLETWDWRETLRVQQRSIPWLARRTDRAQQTVYNYAHGTARTPIEWLRAAADVLGVRVR